ncbi:hypothetical protein CMV_001470 [Castanea mollissima]|uniref:Uncharacterized protein n=1 Tax=Castanea mollissima TaxID=60419 RepID=A0A8J4VWX2_9ROSI|nr:hypothetical protein CMV_001470 [Castanea mollissima]
MSPIIRVVKSTSVRLDPKGFFGWIGSSDGFGQLYSLPFFFSKRYVSYTWSKYEIVRIQDRVSFPISISPRER